MRSKAVSQSPQRKAVFLDKDGTLIPDIPFNANPDLITISKETTDTLRWLRDQEYLLIIVSNQPGIARGYFTDEQIMTVWEKIVELLGDEGVEADGFYYCPHDSVASLGTENILCECRKPKPGMLLEAAADFDLNLRQSWMVGDILHDVEAGNRAVCTTVLLDNGNETEWKMSPWRRPDYTITSIGGLKKLIAQHVHNEKKEYDLQGDHQSVR